MMPKRLFPWILVLIALGVVAVVLFSPRSPMNKKAEVLPYSTSQNSANGLVLPLVQLDGQWFSRDKDTTFIATVAGQEIEVQVSFSGETSALYWHGSFKSAESPGVAVASTKIELPDEIVLSQSASKNFEIKQDAIVFDFSAMGFTQKVTMTRG